MSELSIKLEGFPEKVQRIADVLEEAFPDMFIWVQSQELTDGISIKIDGYEMPAMPTQAPRPLAA